MDISLKKDNQSQHESKPGNPEAKLKNTETKPSYDLLNRPFDEWHILRVILDKNFILAIKDWYKNYCEKQYAEFKALGIPWVKLTDDNLGFEWLEKFQITKDTTYLGKALLHNPELLENETIRSQIKHLLSFYSSKGNWKGLINSRKHFENFVDGLTPKGKKSPRKLPTTLEFINLIYEYHHYTIKEAFKTEKARSKFLKAKVLKQLVREKKIAWKHSRLTQAKAEELAKLSKPSLIAYKITEHCLKDLYGYKAKTTKLKSLKPK
jgi:hypothetical protein